MRSRISIRGCVRPSVGPSVRRSVRWSVRRSVRPSPVIFRRVLGASCAVYPALLSFLSLSLWFFLSFIFWSCEHNFYATNTLLEDMNMHLDFLSMKNLNLHVFPFETRYTKRYIKRYTTVGRIASVWGQIVLNKNPVDSAGKKKRKKNIQHAVQ